MSYSGKTSLNFMPEMTVIFPEAATLKRIIKQIHFLFQTELVMIFLIELQHHNFYFVTFILTTNPLHLPAPILIKL